MKKETYVVVTRETHDVLVARLAELEEDLAAAVHRLTQLENEARWDSHDCDVLRDRRARAMMGK